MFTSLCSLEELYKCEKKMHVFLSQDLCGFHFFHKQGSETGKAQVCSYVCSTVINVSG